MTKTQMIKAKANVPEIIKLYKKASERSFKKLGYSYQCAPNMLGFTESALLEFFKIKKITVSWDEACEIFDGHK